MSRKANKQPIKERKNKNMKYTIIKAHQFMADEPLKVVLLPKGKNIADLRNRLKPGLVARRATKAEIESLKLEHISEAEFLFG